MIISWYLMNEKTIVSNRRQVLSLSLPIAVQNIFSTAVGSADVIMVGRVSQSALSAVSLAGQVLFVLNLILLGLTIGTSLLVSQYYGKGDFAMIERIQGFALRIAFLVSGCFAAVSILFPTPLMRVFTDDAELITLGATYLRILGASFLFLGPSQVLETVMKAVMRVRISTVIGTSALILNVLFNALFIFGWLGLPRLGAAGAALGTVLARLIELLWCVFATFRPGQVKIRREALFHTEKGLKKDFWHFSLPITLNGLSWGTAFATYSVILGHLGSDMVAANSVATVARNFAIVGCTGLSGGSGIYLGAKLGSGDLSGAKRDAGMILRMTLVLALIGGALVLALGPLLFLISDLTDAAEGYLRVMLLINAVYVLTKAYNLMFNNGILSAGGDTKFGLICDTIDMWCYSVPLGFLAAFVFRWPPLIVYLVISTDELAKLPFYYLRYQKGFWVRNLTKKEANT